jgi:hypothetical protein
MSGSLLIGLIVAAWIGYVVVFMLVDKHENDIVDSVEVKRITVGKVADRPTSREAPEAEKYVLWLIVRVKPYASHLWSRSVGKAVEWCDAQAPLAVHRVLPYGRHSGNREESAHDGYFPDRCWSLHAFYLEEPHSFDAAIAELKRIVEITNQFATEEAQRVRSAEQAAAKARQNAAETRERELKRIESEAWRALKRRDKR